jgi:hypothetical protein
MVPSHVLWTRVGSGTCPTMGHLKQEARLPAITPRLWRKKRICLVLIEGGGVRISCGGMVHSAVHKLVESTKRPTDSIASRLE